jgi:CTP synthase (UTP-ammonia lyase)
VLGIKDADSAENNPGSKNAVVSPVACAIPNGSPGAARLSGTIPEIRIRPGSYLQGFYKKDVVMEEFFCNYEVNPDFEGAIIDAGFSIAARGSQGEIRAIEFPTHKFFIATLFQPQLSSKLGKPHPLIVEFLRAAAKWKSQKLEDTVLE